MTCKLLALQLIGQYLPDVTDHPVACRFSGCNIDIIEICNVHGNHISLGNSFLIHLYAEACIIRPLCKGILICITQHYLFLFPGKKNNKCHTDQNEYGYNESHQIQTMLNRCGSAFQNICRDDRQHIPCDIIVHQLYRNTVVIILFRQIKGTAI